jgi:glutamate racemase
MIFLNNMDKRPVLFLDSGIGGIPYCRDFQRRNPGEIIIYAADRSHFPYGKRSREELAAIMRALVESFIDKTNPKLVVLACNTATVSALSGLRKSFPSLAFVGTVPAVKPAVIESKKRAVGVLGTARTVEDPYIAELAARYGGDCVIHRIAAPGLVEFVERRYARAGDNERKEAALAYIEMFRKAGVDALVLGCTHFLFLLEEFRGGAAPDIKVYDSVDGISSRVESLLDGEGGKLRAPAGDESGAVLSAAGRFFITGSAGPEPSWQYWADYLGLKLSLLGDIL